MNGSIDHRPDRPKPWRARYLSPDRRQRSKSFETKREAQRWLRDQIGKIDKNIWVDPAGGSLRYHRHARQWLDGLVGIKPKTRAGYESLIESRIIPTFGDIELRRINREAVRAWIAEMDEEGLSPSRIRQARQVLRQSLDQAVHDGLIGRNPTSGVGVPAQAQREMKHLTVRQVQALAEAAEVRQHGAGTLVIFLAYSGLRWGEAVALRRSDLDLLRRQVHVRRAATEISGRLSWGSPKSHRHRTVILARSVIELIGAHLSRVGDRDDLVFTAPQGGPLRSSSFRKKVWLPAVTELEQMHPEVRGLRVHDLRHTAASLAISCGGNIKAVQQMLGHKHASMTLDRYGHLYIDDLEQLAERMDEKFRGAA